MSDLFTFARSFNRFDHANLFYYKWLVFRHYSCFVDMASLLLMEIELRAFRSTAAMLCMLGATVVSNPASASLIGETISGSGLTLSPTVATIGAGVEFSGVNNGPGSDDTIDFDFGANTLTISSKNFLTAWFGMGTFTFGGFDEIIKSFSLTSNTGFSANFITDYSFTSDSITLNMDFGLVTNSQQGDVAVFNINSNAEVPEPTSLALIGLALAGVSCVRRRNIA
jgi:hypothetical protein